MNKTPVYVLIISDAHLKLNAPWFFSSASRHRSASISSLVLVRRLSYLSRLARSEGICVSFCGGKEQILPNDWSAWWSCDYSFINKSVLLMYLLSRSDDLLGDQAPQGGPFHRVWLINISWGLMENEADDVMFFPFSSSFLILTNKATTRAFFQHCLHGYILIWQHAECWWNKHR